MSSKYRDPECTKKVIGVLPVEALGPHFDIAAKCDERKAYTIIQSSGTMSRVLKLSFVLDYGSPYLDVFPIRGSLTLLSHKRHQVENGISELKKCNVESSEMNAGITTTKFTCNLMQGKEFKKAVRTMTEIMWI